MYRLSARVRGQRVMEVPLNDQWQFSDEDLLRAIEMAAPNVVFIASPNNPTGTMIEEKMLEKVIQGAPETLIVVDEAYVDYADRHQMGLLQKYANVAVLRTLSKVGFASLRVGWLVGSPELVAELDKVRLPYNLPTVCQSLATLVFDEFSDEIKSITHMVKDERRRVAVALEKMSGVHVVPSQANFLWLELEKSASDVFKALGNEGVLVRSFHGRGGRLEKCIRVTIGTPAQNDRFVKAMSVVL
jgi:histidinol-phosphate aminotransferase